MSEEWSIVFLVTTLSYVVTIAVLYKTVPLLVVYSAWLLSLKLPYCPKQAPMGVCCSSGKFGSEQVALEWLMNCPWVSTHPGSVISCTRIDTLSIVVPALLLHLCFAFLPTGQWKKHKKTYRSVASLPSLCSICHMQFVSQAKNAAEECTWIFSPRCCCSAELCMLLCHHCYVYPCVLYLASDVHEFMSITVSLS